jgi:hypothetical protein
LGRVYKTTNYGANWAVTTTAPFTAITTGKIYITGTGKIIAAGILTGGTSLTWKQSTDGGATWTTYAPTGAFYQYAMTYVPYSGNMLVSTAPYTTSKGVSYSNNNGASFTDFLDALLQPTAGTNIQCLGVGFSDINHGWVGNYAATINGILKYTNNAVILSNAAEILSFTIPNQVGSSVVNSAAATISINVPFGTDVTALVPTITLSSGATVNPASGVAQNFASPKQFTVTAQNGIVTKIWTVTVTVNVGIDAYSIGNISINPNPASGIVNFTLPEYNKFAQLRIFDITGKTIFEQFLNGITQTSFDCSKCEKGIYFAKFNIDNKISVKKIIIN